MAIRIVQLAVRNNLNKLGSAVEIYTRLNEADIASGGTATITIADPNANPLSTVTDVALTQVMDYIYRYVWQSPTYLAGALEGQYTAIITITSGGVTKIDEIPFTMERTTNNT